MAKIKTKARRGKEKAKPEHPDCDAEMEMTRVVRVDGASGMFWVCSKYSSETPVLNKAGVVLDPLKLR